MAKELVVAFLENLAHWALATEVIFWSIYLLGPSMMNTVDDAISVTAIYFLLKEKSTQEIDVPVGRLK